MKKLVLLSALCFFFSLNLMAQEENALVVKSNTFDQKANKTTTKLYLLKDKLLMEINNGKDESVMLYDAEKDAMYIIDHKKRKYTEMTKEDLQQLSQQLKTQMEMMEKQLASLPENQREMIKAQMKKMGGGSSEPVQYKKEESGVNVNGWKSDKYVGTSGSQKKSEVFVTTYIEMKRNKEDFAVMEDLMKFFKEYMQDFAKNMPYFNSASYFDADAPMYKDRVPVKTIVYDDKGEIISTSTVESVGEEPLALAKLEIPKNYKKQKLVNEK